MAPGEFAEWSICGAAGLSWPLSGEPSGGGPEMGEIRHHKCGHVLGKNEDNPFFLIWGGSEFPDQTIYSRS